VTGEPSACARSRNTEGHAALRDISTVGSQRVRVALESRACTVWTWLIVAPNAQIDSHVATHARLRHFASALMQRRRMTGSMPKCCGSLRRACRFKLGRSFCTTASRWWVTRRLATLHRAKARREKNRPARRIPVGRLLRRCDGDCNAAVRSIQRASRG